NQYGAHDFHGAGIFCLNSSPRIEYLIVRDNIIRHNFPGSMYPYYGEGGGLYCENSSPIITRVDFYYNGANISGAMYCIKNSSPRIIDVTMTGHWYGTFHCDQNSNPEITNMVINGSRYGGFSCYDSSPTIRRLTVSNTSSFGFSCGGSSYPTVIDLSLQSIGSTDGESGRSLYCTGKSSPMFLNTKISSVSFIGIECSNGSTPVFVNAVIDSVYGDNHVSISCDNSSPVFINTTVLHSNAFGQYWGKISGVYSKSNARPRLVNCIIKDHAYGINCDGGRISISHSNIWNNKLANFNKAPDSLGVFVRVNANGDSCDAFFNISKNPKFIDSYNLSKLSPCIGAGTPEGAPEFDLAGVRRHNPPDMGAYEYPQRIGVEEQSPVSFALLPNYPNPFNPTTTISFSLQKEDQTELTVYDITGRKVQTLLAQKMSAGEHSVVWDGRDDKGKPVSSGVYFTRLAAGKRIATGKMLLIR
ncbi:MAG: right-handed parallel beta-helix repeat-containing protein, partial [Candidatus Latescibacterota bacterium]